MAKFFEIGNEMTNLATLSLAPGSQKKINQLLLHCCVTAFIVTRQTLLKLLTTFLNKHNLMITRKSVSFD